MHEPLNLTFFTLALFVQGGVRLKRDAMLKLHGFCVMADGWPCFLQHEPNQRMGDPGEMHGTKKENPAEKETKSPEESASLWLLFHHIQPGAALSE